MDKSKSSSTSKKLPRGRKKGTRITVAPSNVITAMVERLSLKGEIFTFQDVADSLTARSGVRVTRVTVWNFAVKGIEPRDNGLRRALGLPVTAPGRVCPVHGKVHDKQCRAAKARRLSDLPTRALAWRIRNRSEYAPD